MVTIAGIDFGSKLAGTTVIAWQDEKGQAIWLQSQKKKDADRFILDWATENRPTTIYLDAPLSLPGVFREMAGYEDYFYRKGDRALRAMSPMFLGGLTARAMQLRHQLEAIAVQVCEVYPGALAQHLAFPKGTYKKDKAYLAPYANQLEELYGLTIKKEALQNWHQFDALLALCSGIRHLAGEAQVHGDPEEGQIIV
ncbi:MAG: hypothetical protein AAF798_20355 [Bacteroidota bacterium]